MPYLAIIALIPSYLSLFVHQLKYSGYVNGKDELIDPADESKGKKMIFYENLVPQEGKEYIPQAEINAGQAAWVDALIKGEGNGAQVAFGFVFSPEFIGNNPSKGEFVACMYRAFRKALQPIRVVSYRVILLFVWTM